MTKEQAYNLKLGDVVFLYGNKVKPQKILERHVDILNIYNFSGLVRFERGGYMNVLLHHDNIELAPKGTIPEPKDLSKMKIWVQDPNDLCMMYDIEVPYDDIDRENLFAEKGIFRVDSFLYGIKDIRKINDLKNN